MRPESSRAATAAAAPLESTQVVYSGTARSASAVNDVLARLLFGLESPHLSPTARTGVLGVVESLIRLKIDAGLLTGVTHAE
jgi:hypothetical protein